MWTTRLRRTPRPKHVVVRCSESAEPGDGNDAVGDIASALKDRCFGKEIYRIGNEEKTQAEFFWHGLLVGVKKIATRTGRGRGPNTRQCVMQSVSQCVMQSVIQWVSGSVGE